MSDLDLPHESRFYFYDDLDRLARATDSTGENLFEYGHDAAGNRTFKTDAFGTTSYAYEPGTDRLEAATGAEQAFYAHDAFGNRIYAGSTPYGGVPTYGYNDQNRLVTAKDANGATVTSVYDAFGRRIAWQTMRFVYDQAGRILEVSNCTSPVWVGDVVWVEGELLGRVENNVAAGVPAFAPPAIARFVPRDPAGWVLAIGATGSIVLLLVSVHRRSPRFAWASAVSAGAVLLSLACTPTGLDLYWIYTDQIGFPVAMTNTPATPSQAKVIWRASYEPFGLATEELDPDGDGKQVRMPLRFPGQWWDFATSLHQNGFRTYDPATGRYLEPDPLRQAGSINLYSYAGGDPANGTDPHGLVCLTTVSCARGDNARALAEAFGRAASRVRDAGIAATGTVLLSSREPTGEEAEAAKCDEALDELEAGEDETTIATGVKNVDKTKSEETAREAFDKLAEAINATPRPDREGRAEILDLPGGGEAVLRESSRTRVPTIYVNNRPGRSKIKVRFGRFE